MPKRVKTAKMGSGDAGPISKKSKKTKIVIDIDNCPHPFNLSSLAFSPESSQLRTRFSHFRVKYDVHLFTIKLVFSAHDVNTGKNIGDAVVYVTYAIILGTKCVQIIPQLYSEKKPKMDHMLEEDISNALIGIVMNDSLNGLIKTRYKLGYEH